MFLALLAGLPGFGQGVATGPLARTKWKAVLFCIIGEFAGRATTSAG